MTYRARCGGARRRWTKASYRKAFPLEEGACLGEAIEMACRESKPRKKAPRWTVVLLLPRGWVSVPERGAMATDGARVEVLGAEVMSREIDRIRRGGDYSPSFDGSGIVCAGPIGSDGADLLFESAYITSEEEVHLVPFRPLGAWHVANRQRAIAIRIEPNGGRT